MAHRTRTTTRSRSRRRPPPTYSAPVTPGREPSAAELRAAVEDLISRNTTARIYADSFRHEVRRAQTRENHDEEAAKLDGAKEMRRYGKRLAKNRANAIAQALSTDGAPCHVVEEVCGRRVVVEWRNADGKVLARYVETALPHGVYNVVWNASEPDDVDVSKMLGHYAKDRDLMHVTHAAGRRTMRTDPLVIMVVKLAESKAKGRPNDVDKHIDQAAVGVLSWARHIVGWTGQKSYRGPQLAADARACELNAAAVEAIYVLGNETVRPFGDGSGPSAKATGCGLRFVDVAGLRATDVDLARKVVNVGGRCVPIPAPYALQALRRYLAAPGTPKRGPLFARFRRWILGAKKKSAQ